jgi:hypothetical protein
MRALEARVRALETASGKRRRTRASHPDADVMRERESLWIKYLMMQMNRGHTTVKLTKLAFATRHRLNPSEFTRWLSAADARGIAVGSGPDLNFRKALADAISELGTRVPNARGKLLTSSSQASA